MAKKIKTSYAARRRRHQRVRQKVSGTGQRPRLCVFRSLKHIYAQIIDDSSGNTLLSISTLKIRKIKQKKSDLARATGKKFAQLAVGKGISKVSFDRGGYAYHGRVKALAEGAREGGLEF